VEPFVRQLVSSRSLRCVVAAACLCAAPSASWAAGEIASSAPSAAPDPSLPELPRLAAITFPEPEPAALAEIDKILTQLTSSDERIQNAGKAAIAEVGPSIVPAVRHRIQEIRGALDREVAPRMLESARKAGRKAMKKEGKGKERAKEKRSKDEADADEGDWLDFILAAPHGKEKTTWRHLVSLVAMERMLTAAGTTPAVRELIAMHAYFGELLRIDLQRQVAKLRDKAVPALLEARQHDAKIVQRWATKQLDLLGRAIPGETVASNDTQILADVLRAYGRTRDVDAVRVLLSFCNSEYVQLREASREAIAAIGEPALWQLRDHYLGLTGNKPPKGYTWDRIARELFAMYDRARMVEVYKLMDEGVALAQKNKLADATAAFDKVLARAPLFERRKEMVKTYFARAKELEREKRDDALAMLRKALRLDPKNELAKKIQSEIGYLEGALSIEEGTPDKAVLEKAIELDPENDRARSALASLEEKAVLRETSNKRYFAAGGVGLAALLAMIFLIRRRDPKPPEDPKSGPGAAAPPAGEKPEAAP
jgi:tetratricopeptide (TPR) repeat protein